jgi:hypothetical protein
MPATLSGFLRNKLLRPFTQTGVAASSIASLMDRGA